MIYDDGPKTDINEDILKRKDLVDCLSELIMKMDLTESARIGICGKWGSGKTTVVNFVKQRIKNDVSCIDFNPWLYSSQTDMTSQFLNLLAYKLSSKHRQWMRRHSRVFTSFADSVESVTGSGFGGLFRSFITLLENDVSGVPVTDAKNKISEKLKEEDRRIVVFIDDLDRLDPNEIRMMMKLIRTVADFPNIVYILCYDGDIVEGALNTDIYQGHDYLQKIINIEIRLPEFNQTIVIDKLKEGFQTITGKSELNDYEEALIYKFNYIPMSIRDAKALLSRFRILYDVSNNNTCPIDLLTLTLIQTKSPETYDWISSNRSLLCGWPLQSIEEVMNGKTERTYATDIYDRDEQDPTFKDVLSTMFPRFQQKYHYDETEMIYRIKEPEYIDHYFRLTPSSLDFSDETIEFFINIDSDSFLKLLNENNRRYISDLINRACQKIKILRYECQSKVLSDMCLIQPFGNRTFDIGWVPIIVKIVQTYLRFLNDPNEQIAYLKSSMPTENIHKIITYGSLLKRIQLAFDDEYNKLIIETIYKELEKQIMSADVTEIDNPIEIMMGVILVSKNSEDSAKSLFLKMKPSYEERKPLYEELIEMHYDVSFFTNLVGDGPLPYPGK